MKQPHLEKWEREALESGAHTNNQYLVFKGILIEGPSHWEYLKKKAIEEEESYNNGMNGRM